MEANDDSDEGAKVETSLSAEIVSGISVLGETFHNEVGDVGELGHQEEEVLLDILRNLVCSADVLAVGEAEVGEVREGIKVAS